VSHALVVGSALYVDKLTNVLLLKVEVDSDQRRLITILAATVGEVGGGEALGAWQVGHATISEGLLVCWVSSLTMNPDFVLIRLLVPVRLELCRPFRIIGKVFFINWCWFPTPDLVELEEDTGRDGTTRWVDESVGERCTISKLGISVELVVALANSLVVLFKMSLESL